jgi:hypothetical protein
LIASCSPKGTRQLRRAERLIQKAELNGAKWSSDTVFKDREVITKETKTEYKDRVSNDTIYVYKDKVRTKVLVKNDTIYVESKCLPDTIKIQVPVRVDKRIDAPPCEQQIKWWHCLIGLIVVAVVFLIIGKVV